MKTNHFQVKAAAISTVLSLSPSADATVIMSLSPTENGAILTVTGSFDHEGLDLTPAFNSTSNNFIVDRFESDDPIVGFRSDGSLSMEEGSRNAIFGGVFSGDEMSGAIAAELPYSGDVNEGWGYSGNILFIPASYVSGAPISIMGEYTGPIFANTGGTLVPGESTRLEFSNGEAVIFTTARAIPEPSAVLLVTAGLALGSLRRKRK